MPAPGPPPPNLLILPGPPTYPVLFYIIVSIGHPPPPLSTLCPVTREGLSPSCALIGCSGRVGGTTAWARFWALLPLHAQKAGLGSAPEGLEEVCTLPTLSFELKPVGTRS